MTIAEHTVRTERLGNGSNILDLGCRGFEFANHFRPKHNVYCIDIADLEGAYFQMAISERSGRCSIEKTQDEQGWHIKQGVEIRMSTIAEFSKLMGVTHWDIIKMDIEGEEYNILSSPDTHHPLADQISVEFHAHTGRQTREQLDSLLDYLKTWYYIENRYWEDRHCAGFNYWDVLLIAK